ncbi:GSCOCG00011412001-RA-CDS, partial [Cotesia congregata]
MVPKSNGELRFCVDFRPINRVSIIPANPLPNLLRILSSLHGAVFITTMDLKEAFHQLLMLDDSIKHTAFSVEGLGHFEWVRMPYGLAGAPGTFQKAMEQLRTRHWSEKVFAYFDDWVVISETYEEHKQILALMFEVFREAGVLINPDKCKFARSEVKFLEFLVNQQGLQPDPEKIAPIIQYPRPTNRKQVRRFCGMVNWYHRNLKNVARVQGPLNKLCSPTSEWKWEEEKEKSFAAIKQSLVDAETLAIPRLDFPYFLYTDASDTDLGAFLVQRDPVSGREHLITCLSRPLRGAQVHYPTTDKECLAVIWAVRKLRCYLEGAPFTVVTDHAALKWLHTLKDPTGRLARWA